MRIDSRHSFRHSSEGWNPEGWGWGNVARSKTSRGEGLVPRSRHTGNHPSSRATVDKTRQPAHPFSYLGVPAAIRVRYSGSQ